MFCRCSDNSSFKGQDSATKVKCVLQKLSVTYNLIKACYDEPAYHIESTSLVMTPELEDRKELENSVI